MSDLIVVGITGPAGVGKDTAARSLTYHRDCFRIGFADAVKSAFTDMDGVTRQLTKELEAAGITHRRAWQLCGSEARIKARNHRLWASLALAKIAYLAFYHPWPRRAFVIPDLRFQVEAAVMRANIPALGGRFGILALDRPDREPLSGVLGEHSSEHPAGFAPDRIHVNDGTIDELGEAAVLFFDDLAAGRIAVDVLPHLSPAEDLSLAILEDDVS